MERDYDTEARDHPEHRYAYDFDYRMHRYMMRAFGPLAMDGPALELGCYHGHFTRLLCERFTDVDVVEASAECITQAREATQGRAQFTHARFEEFTPSRAYANIFLIHTLEHLDERAAMLARIGGWLAPGGRLFVATPNAHAGSRQIAVKMGLITHAAAVTPAELAHGHRVTYSLDTLHADIRAAGLRSVWHGGLFFKGLANFQIDAALKAGVISDAYLDGCYELGHTYPDLCSSIYHVCARPAA
ncbi:class I SAM-dependent methyltransferase [Caenimonas sedimenti]|uniref:Class I SAM-dependent methyltransferase n=1 Tax=Caenimonas sedimenti TaxID=2596921 RepID=A0A562ZG13_9BURK|nr:class I SAM-dependent methyltransferase [Caenimonas sedimenti]TWO66652.1 class I SAM-dependent methyltransferase [Caenimonas sedimenti]